LRDPTFSHFCTVPACDGQAHDDSIYRASIASRGNKIVHSLHDVYAQPLCLPEIYELLPIHKQQYVTRH